MLEKYENHENHENNENNENNGCNGFCCSDSLLTFPKGENHRFCCSDSLLTFSKSGVKSGGIKRQYTLTCEEDFKNINKGLCPDYALCWCDEYNAKYWPQLHDFKGNIEKRLIMNALRCIILRKLNDLRNKTLPLFYVKEVRFNIFKEIIPFDEELPPLDLRYF
jgi:hypothetical protein